MVITEKIAIPQNSMIFNTETTRNVFVVTYRTKNESAYTQKRKRQKNKQKMYEKKCCF